MEVEIKYYALLVTFRQSEGRPWSDFGGSHDVARTERLILVSGAQGLLMPVIGCVPDGDQSRLIRNRIKATRWCPSDICQPTFHQQSRLS